MLVIDFSTPQWLINYYHTIGTISLFFNSFGLYMLMFQNNKLDKIRYFMMAYQIACFCTDVHLTLFMQPVPLYPLFGGFIVGILAEWFDISTHVSMLFIILLVVVQLEFLVYCFEKKHQAIANTLNIHVLPYWFSRFCYFLSVVCPIVVTIWFHTVRLGKEEQWDFIKTNFPQYLDYFRSLSHFDIYMKTPSFIILLLLTICGGLVLVTLFLLFIIDIFRMMIHLKLKISSVTYRKHKEAIQNLMIQFATSSFCVAPPCCLAIVIMLELDQAQLLTELCICWFATHSSVNTISLLIFFSPYRNFILKQLRALVYQ
ncbi:hypothetical protein CRE_06603 [Caenorhabditis remanei]|uniref:Serpentine Receptor, class I n=1 Tax=Caenorhabditis remanei TaxID=31234 RepID=E3M1R4_CAERE|nr:hypothetical protein CRE_06603 [Caenorhabditis remanei]